MNRWHSKKTHVAARFAPPPDATILDIGAGLGRNSPWFAEQGDDIVAVEPSNALRKLATLLAPNGRIAITLHLGARCGARDERCLPVLIDGAVAAIRSAAAAF